MDNKDIPLILQCSLFLIPINIYIIGDWIGSGMQTIFFRYIQTNQGNSLLFFYREFQLILKGYITGKSALSSEIWYFGVFLLCCATLFLLYIVLESRWDLFRFPVFLNILGAIILLVSLVIQYGYTLSGPAGTAIPLGIPILLGVAFFQYRWGKEMNTEDFSGETRLSSDTESEDPEVSAR